MMAHRSSHERTIEHLRAALTAANERITAMQAGVQSHLDSNADKPATEDKPE